jgi:hypothetical protein
MRSIQGGSQYRTTARQTKLKAALISIGISAVLLTGGVAVLGQNVNAGEIRGTVTDSTGANIPKVDVSLTNQNTGVTTTTTTDSGGVYDVPQLTPGIYSISFRSPSFKTAVQQNVLLQNGPITVNGTLQVGDATEQVVVNANATVQLQTEDSQQNLTIDARTIEGLPNAASAAQGWFNETALIPGVSGGGGQTTNGTGIGINGGESYQESFLLNGGTVTLIGSQNPDWIINPTDFIAENDFDTHTFNASSGNGAAIFNVITKSGTKRFHGSVYDYNVNSYFGARNYFSTTVPPLSSNLFGGTTGGPILKDRLFFFFGFQRLGSTTGSTGFATVPTDAERAGNFAGFDTIFNPATTTKVGNQTVRTPFPDNQIPSAQFNQQALNIQKYFPEPNLPGLANNYAYSQQVNDITYWYNGKVDYNFNRKNHLNASGSAGTINFPSPTPYTPIGEYAELGKEQAYQISETLLLSPTAINEARFSMIRFSGNWVGGDYNKGYPAAIGIPNPTSDVFPNIGIVNITGFSTGLDAVLAEDSFVPSDVFTLVRGKHILKFGGEFDDYEVNINFGGESDGSFNFNGIATLDPQGTSPGVAYADFLLGDVASYGNTITPETGSRLKSTQVFVQDDYKIRPNLTVNLGLRYEVQPGWKEAQNRVGDFDPTLFNQGSDSLGAIWYAGAKGRTSVEATQYGLVQPRVGFAWSPAEHWVIRGGFGLYDELFGYNTYAGSTGLGENEQVGVSSTDGLTPVFNLAQGPPPLIVPSAASLTPSLFNGQGISYIPYQTKVPYMEEYQLDVQHEMSEGVLLEAAYVGSHGEHIALAADSNQIPQNMLYHFTGPGVNMQSYRPYTQYQGISTTIGGGTSHYDSLQLRAQKQYSRGLQFIANFTYSHTLDDGTGSGYGGAGADGSLWQNGYNPASSYGNSLLDIPITFNGDVIYELPVGQGKLFLNRGGVANSIVGGWIVSGLYQVHSGTPFTPYLPVNNSGSLAGTWFPNRIGSGHLADPTISHWFNTADFVQPAFGTYGDSGRDILFGPPWRQLDISASKHWKVSKLGEQADLQVRLDAADVLNNPNFSNPNSAIGNPGAGIITGANTSRSLQFTGKFTF